MESPNGQTTLKTQLAVLGGGGAGLSAAAAAVEAGLSSVLVLEKRAALGGNTALATGLFACESPVQARLRILADKDEMFRRAVKFAHWSRVDPKIIRAFVNKSGDTIRWLEEKGVVFDIRPFAINQNPRIWHCPQGRGAKLVDILGDHCRKMGVRLLTKCRGTRIVRHENDRIAGVCFEDGDSHLSIEADSVVIATGGFAGNKELLKEKCPLFYDDFPLRGLPLAGDGLAMAAATGAALADFATLLKEGPRVDLNSWPLKGLERSAETVWVNRGGIRFIDESEGEAPFECVNAILMQPDKICFSLADQRIVSNHEIKNPGLVSALEKLVRKDKIKVASDWEAIARWMGTDPLELATTIKEYNRFCDQGYDEDFDKNRRYLMPLKEPPFFAIRCLPTFLDTIGGILVNEHMEVLGQEHAPIPGLYAAGVVASGWMAETYCNDLSGSAFGFALNSGRIAGENAAGYILAQNRHGELHGAHQ